MTNNQAFVEDENNSSLSLKDLLNLLKVINKTPFLEGFRKNIEDYTRNADDTPFYILEQTAKLFCCETCSLLILYTSEQTDNPSMITRLTYSERFGKNHQVIIQPEASLSNVCLQTASPILSSNPSLEKLFNPIIDAPNSPDSITNPVNNLLFVPIISQNFCLGLIQLINKKQENFTETDQDFLSLEATVLANAIQSERRIQQLHIVNAELEANRWQLLNSQNIFRTLFDSIPASIYIINRKYQLVAVNFARAQYAGIQTKEEIATLISQICYEALLHRDSPCPGCRVLETLFDGKSTTRTERRWDNEEEPTEWEINSYPIFNDDQQALQAILLEQNVTEKRRLEATLAQSEKLAAVGQLAAGVAHEINNPLTAIIANTQLLQRELSSQSKLKNKKDIFESLDLIQRAGARAIQVVRNLLNFARKERYELVPTDINENIRSALDLLHHEIMGRMIDLTFEPQENLPIISTSPNHLQGVWLNLVLNAMDSIENSHGKIKIQTFQSGNNIHVKVSDSGKGIPENRIPRIFEPFYTTKGPDRGTGLGLSVCHRIVKQHGGHIIVDSQVDVGTEFTVVLPIHNA